MNGPEANDELDGCAVDMAADPTPDDAIDGVVLFADVDLDDAEAVATRAAEWRELFGGTH